MESNFEFLNDNEDLQTFYKTAKDAEASYKIGVYDGAFDLIRKVIENVARMELDLNYVEMPPRSNFNDCLSALKREQIVERDVLEKFYDLKQLGNKASHTMIQYTQAEAKAGLQDMYDILLWFSKNYDLKENLVEQDFVDPNTFQTAIRKLIYVQTVQDDNDELKLFHGLEKVGEATVDSLEHDNKPNSEYLRARADGRINGYMQTAGLKHITQWAELAYRSLDNTWFRDYDIHHVLLRSGVKRSTKTAGNEWFKTDVETVKKAIAAYKNGKESIDINKKSEVEIVLRPEQKAAIEKTKKAFKKYPNMLWNAKMRFGKTLSALQLIKEQSYQKVLIMTHRPVVDVGWYEDFKKIGMPKAGYNYGSKKEGESFTNLVKFGNPFVYFASLQDLRGSKIVGGVSGDKNERIFNTDWDLIIIDEAHEGTQTQLAQRVIDLVVKNDTKLLELSGTPFNLLDKYEDDQVFTWDYVMEQKAKKEWSQKHPNEKNPYEGLPKVSMYTFSLGEHFKNSQFTGDSKKSFNFKEFFRVNEEGRFIYEDKVKQFLDNISSPDSKTNYPFSTKLFRSRLRHTLWILPGVKEANALEDLLKKHSVFGMEYDVVNVVRFGDNSGLATQNDVDKVNRAIGPDPTKTKTITLTVRKLTTGVTIKPWTGVMFLSNVDSAMQYLQAAFRAQTPYSSENFGQKTNCYIFDFAPDRALTVMAATNQLNVKVGQRNTQSQKKRMSELLNFLPIVGETGHGMQPFKVDRLLSKVKRVYAEKAVRAGFDDDSLYSDKLLDLKDMDLADFNKLKAIVGSTKKEKAPVAPINAQGFDEEEYDKAKKAEKKPKNTRTPEEQAAINKKRAVQEQRRKMISILRSVSIRIPMMIYGMNVDLNQDVDINTFVKNVDDKSWIEFMPKGVTKGMFKKFTEYYDPDVFIEAGRIIRNRVKRLDNLDPISRTEKLADIFGSFKNPDKETVLTPWKVVNQHLGSTLGGYSFYDDDYKYRTIDGVGANHWIETPQTNQLNKKKTFLEINSKTALYPLYITMSIYWQEFQKMNSETAGKFTVEDELDIWQKILKENIFVIAKTPMAKSIAQRTLSGYRDFKCNIKYVKNIVEDASKNAHDEANKIKELFGNMKFDVIIGNPPYQESDNDSGKGSAKPIYQHFVQLSKELNPDLITLITPSVWFTGGKGLNDYRDEMLHDPHLEAIYNFDTPKDVFPTANLRGGVNYFLWNKEYDNQKDGVKIDTIHNNEVVESGIRPLMIKDVSILISSNKSYEILQKLLSNHDIVISDNDPKMFWSIVSVRNPFSIATTFKRTKKFHEDTQGLVDPIKIYASKETIGYTERQEISKNEQWIDCIKVLTPFANNIGTDLKDDNLNTIIAGKETAATETYLVVGADLNLDMDSAEAIAKYMKTKFVRFLISLAKANQNGTRQTYQFVPNQDFTKNSDINWSNSLLEIDKQLFEKYNLDEREQEFINGKINK